MKIERRRIVQLIAAASMGAGIAPALLAQQQRGGPVRFKTLNPPQPVEVEKGKIEVIEFFWYGCPHCYAVEPSLEAWLKRLPSDVVFRRVPPALAQGWVPHAQAYYAFEVLGVLPKVHRAFFDAIHRDRLRVDNRQAMEQWLEKNGVPPAKFEEAARSFAVQTSVRRAVQMAAHYQVEGVPTFAIQGRYTVGTAEVPEEAVVAAVEQIVASTRRELGLPPPAASGAAEPAGKAAPARKGS